MQAQWNTVEAVDFSLVDHGSVIAFTPCTLDAQTFTDTELVVEGWQWMGDGFFVDRGVANQLVDFLMDNGFTVL